MNFNRLIFFHIAILTLLTSIAYAEPDIYPSRLLTSKDFKQFSSEENLNTKQNIFSSKNANIGTIETRLLLEPIIDYPEGFINLDPIKEIFKEETQYSYLNFEEKEALLYKKQEKVKNFFEKQAIEKFLDFDFQVSSINNITNENIRNSNQHLPLLINPEIFKKQAFELASSGDLVNLRALIENKTININIVDENNKNLLMYAVKNQQINVVRFLIAYGIDINSQDKLGNSAISYTYINSPLYKILIMFGATSS